MEIATLNVIKDIFSDAIKILGPAIITGFFGYKAGTAQLDVKIKEIKHTNKFKAHEHLFNYYKEWQNHISEKYEQLTSTLGTLTGIFAADPNGEHGLNPLVFKFFGSYVKSAPHDIDMTLRDLNEFKEKYQIEIDLLNKCKLDSLRLKSSGDVNTVFRTVADLIEIYSHLNRCAHLLVEEQAKLALKPYLESNES